MTTTALTAATTHGDQAAVSTTGCVSGDTDEALTAAFTEVQKAGQILVSFPEASLLNSVGIAILLDLILPVKDQGIGP